MSRVRIYVEGGGDGPVGKGEVRKGFHQFLREFEGSMPAIIACGGRNQAYHMFQTACHDHSDDFVILLVDAEGPVRPGAPSSRHLTDRDGWSFTDIDGDRVHLMVQAVEAWLIANCAVDIGPVFTIVPQGPATITVAPTDTSTPPTSVP